MCTIRNRFISISNIDMNTSKHSTLSATSVHKTHKTQPSHIPVRLTRAQRLANQKRQELYNTSSSITNSLEDESFDHLETRSVSSVHTTSRTSRIPSTTKKPQPKPHPKQPPHPKPRTLSKNLPSTHVHKMIHELTMIFSSAHYAKVSNEYIKQDSRKTWKAKSIFAIPISQEENREEWIQTHLSEYPLTMADMIARGAFQHFPSEFPTVEVFRQSYMDKHSTYTHNHTSLWEACGNPFPITTYPLVNWDTIKLYYDSSRNKRACQSCMNGEPTWYLHFWKYRGNELKQYGYTPPS